MELLKNSDKMKELKTLRVDSDLRHFMECYEHNKNLVGRIDVRLDIYCEYIKILSAFPLKDKKLKYFLQLDSKAKCGYMSSYIMKVARKMNVSKSLIEQFHDIKSIKKIYNRNIDAKEIGELLMANDIKNALSEYKYTVKHDIYTEQLSKQTKTLCSSIFEQFDKARLQIIKSEQ